MSSTAGLNAVTQWGEPVENCGTTSYYCSSTSSRSQFYKVERVTEKYPNPMFGLTLKMKGRKKFNYQSCIGFPK